MIKSKFKRTLILGMCFTAMSTGVALASGVGSQPAVLPGQMPADMVKLEIRQAGGIQEVPVDSLDAAVSYPTQWTREIKEEIFQKQREIDKYLFEDHAEAILKKGFSVTHTGPFDGYVEIGITPYSEENAKYLYDIFGKEQIKVVEGQQAYTLSIGSREPAMLDLPPELTIFKEEIVNKQIEIDQYLFDKYEMDVNEKGFRVTHTVPFEDYVELGITPYSEENANYLYEIFGRDMVKIVEGQEYELRTELAASGVEMDIAATNGEDASKSSPSKSPLIYPLGAIMLLGGSVIVKGKLK